MANPTLYKKVTASAARNKVTTTLSADELSAAKNIVTEFFSLFTSKHSG
tara:strand:- start:2695 stop:2841 length:147 start_codon:yes stop_codon:yes gene_type:complete